MHAAAPPDRRRHDTVSPNQTHVVSRSQIGRKKTGENQPVENCKFHCRNGNFAVPSAAISADIAPTALTSRHVRHDETVKKP